MIMILISLFDFTFWLLYFFGPFVPLVALFLLDSSLLF